MSRPNHALALGFSRACASTAASGWRLVKSDGQTAMTMNRTMSTTENQKIGFFLSERQASDVSDLASSSVPSGAAPVSALTAIDASVMADPRVEYSVQQV